MKLVVSITRIINNYNVIRMRRSFGIGTAFKDARCVFKRNTNQKPYIAYKQIKKRV